MKEQAIRTTVDIPASLYRKLKEQAVAQGRSIRDSETTKMARPLEGKKNSFILKFFESTRGKPKKLSWFVPSPPPLAQRFQDAQQRELAAEVALV